MSRRAPPLGIGGGPIESRQFDIDDGSLFVLYTDGLVENRTRDIDDGLNRLRGVFGPGSTDRPLEDSVQGRPRRRLRRSPAR